MQKVAMTHQTTSKDFKRIAVFCGSSIGKNREYAAQTVLLGKEMVKRNIGLVYGGGNVGLMGVIAETVYEGLGDEGVLGVIPDYLEDREVSGKTVGKTIVVKDMHSRKAKMFQEADAFIAIPGGLGTLDETIEISTWQQLGLHCKPVGLLNINGYFDKLVEFLDHATSEEFIRPASRAIVLEDSDPSSLIDKLLQYEAPPSVIKLAKEGKLDPNSFDSHETLAEKKWNVSLTLTTGFVSKDMVLNQISNIRGIGTLSRIVGPNIGQVDSSEAGTETGQHILREKTVSRDGYQCPVCWREFNDGSSEAIMSEHVEICLANSEKSKPKKQKSLRSMVARSVGTVAAGKSTDRFIGECDTLEGSGISVGAQSCNDDGMSFETQIVGRRFSRNQIVRKGDQFEIVWEENNKYDPNATLAVALKDKSALGHVPRVVAAKLGPLLKAGIAQGRGIVLEEAVGVKNVPVRISLTFNKVSSSVRSEGGCIKELGDIAAKHKYDMEIGVYSTRSLQRVHKIFDVVQSIEAKALGEVDHGFMLLFKSQSPAGQIVFASLAQRQRKYFSTNALQNRYSDEVKSAVTELSNHGLLTLVHMKESLSHALKKKDLKQILCDLFQKRELLDILTSLRGHSFEAAALMHDVSIGRLRGKRKDELVDFIVDCVTGGNVESRNSTLQMIFNVTGGIVSVTNEYAQSFQRIQRLFFLNEGHSLGTWEAVESGYIRYPNYAITREQEVFPNRVTFLEYEKSLFAAERLIHAIQEKDSNAIDHHLESAWEILDKQENKISDSNELLPPFFVQYNSKWIYCVMATVGIGLLERRKEYKLAIERLQQLLGGVYCKERRGYWWIRLSINLEHIGRPTDSLEIAETALADSSIRPDEKLTLQRRIIKLSKPPRRWKKPSWAKHMPKDPKVVFIKARPLDNLRGGKSRFLGYDSEICSVEQLALQYYASDEGGCYEGIHSESGIWCTIFGLLLWPALFQPLPNVFRTPFQTGPLDLGFPGFYEVRKSTIDEILEDVRQGNGPFLVEKCWRDHYGVTARGISWEKYDLSTLQSIITCVGGPGIAAVCLLMCQDYSSWTGGMPDLLLWRPGTQSAKLSEVKGPRDTLSDKQRAWLSFLETSGIDVEVLKVKEPQAPKGKRKNNLHEL